MERGIFFFDLSSAGSHGGSNEETSGGFDGGVRRQHGSAGFRSGDAACRRRGQGMGRGFGHRFLVGRQNLQSRRQNL